MKRPTFIFGFNCLLSVLSVAFAAQVAVIVADPRLGDHINQIAPVFGVACRVDERNHQRVFAWL